MDIFQLTMPALSGEEIAFQHYQGQVLLIVNVASACGYTPQYRGLQALYSRYAAQGFAVLGFPCNQFGGQEPGTAVHIAAFCEQRYGVTFPLFAKVEVNGARQCALFAQLTSKDTNPTWAGPIEWNFEKFVLGRTGHVVARFSSDVEPESRAVTQAIERELAHPLPLRGLGEA